jgi:hypothetical protein
LIHCCSSKVDRICDFLPSKAVRRRESNPQAADLIALQVNDLRNGRDQSAAPGQREGGIVCRELAETDHHYSVELQRIVDVWPNLSIEVRRAIAALINTIAMR